MSEADAATAAESTEDAEARGFVGDADPRDRDEYALTSGPESPSAAETQAEARVAEAQAHLDEIKANVQSRGAGAKEAHAEHKAARQTRRGES
jgi:hypothetical protein